MKGVRIRVDGSRDLVRALHKRGVEARRMVAKASKATAIEIRGDIVKRIHKGPASGHVYEKYSPRRTHQSSAPGQAPMTDTGALANSVVWRAWKLTTYIVESHLKYSKWLEYGSRRMKPRPAWRPAVEQSAPRFQRRLEIVLQRLNDADK